MTRFNFVVDGTPCVVKVTYFNKVKPWSGPPENCQSDLDWYGYTEVEYELYDLQGYRAEWLEDCVDDKTNDEIERQAERHVTEL